MTYQQAVSRACERSRKSGREYFVVYEDHEYYVTDEDDLDTFWLYATPLGCAIGGEWEPA